MDRAALLTNNARYAGVRNATDWLSAVAYLGKSGYASDSGYASKLTSIIKSNKLFIYDDIAKKLSFRDLKGLSTNILGQNASVTAKALNPNAPGPGPGYQGMTTNTERMWNLAKGQIPGLRFTGGYSFRNAYGGKKLSKHAYGLAFDAAGSHQAMYALSRLMGSQPSLDHVIYNREILSAARAKEGWRKYGGPGLHPHTDHVHSAFKYEQGTPWVPSNQLAVLHKGEAVVPAEFNPFFSGGRDDTSMLNEIINKITSS